MKYNYIIFDMDGTLLDTKYGLIVAIRKGLETFRLEKPFPEEELVANWGGDVAGILADFVVKNSASTQTQKEIARELLSRYDHAVWNEYVKPFQGVPALLCALRQQGCKLYVFSNTPDPITKEIISCFFPDEFEVILGLHTHAPKPDATALQQLFRQHCINPSEAVMVGDTITDYQTARNAEIDFCGVLWDDTPPVHALMKLEGATLLQTPEALLAYLLSC